jgi:hypothetical protein
VVQVEALIPYVVRPMMFQFPQLIVQQVVRRMERSRFHILSFAVEKV